MQLRALTILLLCGLCACRAGESTSKAASALVPQARPIPMDQHSHAQPDKVRVTHARLALAVDFERQELQGSVTLEIERLDPTAPLVLDSQGLAIEDVMGEDGERRRFELSPEAADLGSALTIQLKPGDRSVTVLYHTTSEAKALQWLAPEQTAGGKLPYLFTQGQAVFTRTWIPLQDTPGVRIGYDATIWVPEGFTAVMSAERVQATGEPKPKPGAKKEPRGVEFRFSMQKPIPSYLIALAVGDLAFEPMSGRTGVWAEPSIVHGAAAELSDTEAMVASAEKLFGPYRWGRYDLLILPPSFPYGGMENPRLTFATPTILAGDKSLVGLVAHELAHSWSGNLVTNATWSDFWLNEGFTVYFEQRIMEQVFGRERSQMEQQLARADLEQEMAELEPWQQVLHIDLTGHHPDDGFSSVPYEKGALFLRRLEKIWGRNDFDAFLRGYFDSHAFQSITTDDFVAYLQRELFARDPKKAAEIDLAQWLDQPGMPADAPRAKSTLLDAVDREMSRWQAGTPPKDLDTHGWATQQWQHFIQSLPADLGAQRMLELDQAFGFTQTGNSEILCDWLVEAIRNRYVAADPRLNEFLMNVGRRKYLKPLYSEMAKCDDGMARARAIYAKARPRYHAVSTGTIDKILKWN